MFFLLINQIYINKYIYIYIYITYALYTYILHTCYILHILHIFEIYINDLNHAIKFCKVHHFPDDTNLVHIPILA